MNQRYINNAIHPVALKNTSPARAYVVGVTIIINTSFTIHIEVTSAVTDPNAKANLLGTLESSSSSPKLLITN